MFSQVFFAVEPPPESEEASRIGRDAKSTSSAVNKGVQKVRPIVVKAGSMVLALLRRLGEAALKGIKRSLEVAKSRLRRQEDATGSVAADEEPIDES